MSMNVLRSMVGRSASKEGFFVLTSENAQVGNAQTHGNIAHRVMRDTVWTIKKRAATAHPARKNL